MPFGRAVFLCGEAIEVPAALDDAGTEHWRLLIEERMNALIAEADRRVGREATQPGTLGRARMSPSLATYRALNIAMTAVLPAPVANFGATRTISGLA